MRIASWLGGEVGAGTVEEAAGAVEGAETAAEAVVHGVHFSLSHGWICRTLLLLILVPHCGGHSSSYRTQRSARPLDDRGGCC